MTVEYYIDVRDWYVDKWRNDITLYNECHQLFGDMPERCSGVYHILKGDELLYVGCTVNFKSRITEHLVVNSNTKEFINEATHVKCYPIADKYEREIREYEEILNLQPSKNKKLPNLKIINRNKPTIDARQ
jgi:excinuclease UvrABC nuclease subunit